MAVPIWVGLSNKHTQNCENAECDSKIYWASANKAFTYSSFMNTVDLSGGQCVYMKSDGNKDVKKLTCSSTQMFLCQITCDDFPHVTATSATNCVFPFIYQGHTFQSCTCLDTSPVVSWCATSVDPSTKVITSGKQPCDDIACRELIQFTKKVLFIIPIQ